MNRAARNPLSTVTTSQIFEMFMNETESDEIIYSTDSGTAYDDHMPSVSEHSDVEDANPIDPPAITMVSCALVGVNMDAQTELIWSKGRRRSGRRRGRERGRSGGARVEDTAAQTVSQSLFGKDKFRWGHDLPSVGHRHEQDIIRQQPSITALAFANANNLADTFQGFISKEMVAILYYKQTVKPNDELGHGIKATQESFVVSGYP